MRRWRRWTASGTAVVAVAGAGAVGGWALSGPGGSGTAPGGGSAAAPARLVGYASCSQFLDQVRSEALHEVQSGQFPQRAPFGTLVTGDGVVHGAVATPALAAPMASAAVGTSTASGSAATAGSQGSSAPGPSYSGTNDQVAGVDEPDLVKTDGQVLVALRQSTGTLEVADVSGSPALAGSLSLDHLVRASGLFLVGHDVVVLGDAVSSPGGGALSSGGGASSPGEPTGQPVVPVATPDVRTEVVVVDVSDPAAPTMVRSFSIEGTEMAARLIDGTVEVVVSSSPTLPFVAPANDSAGAVSAAMAANRTAIESSAASDWLPSVTSEPSGITTTAPCSSALHTVGDTGLSTIGVVPIDPSSDQPGPEATVVGDAQSVYASASNLYVAFSGAANGTTAPPGPSSDGTTTIDAFDLSDPATPKYVGTGTVPGTLIGQYAMSEYQGDLRVATTVGMPTPPPMEGSAPSTLSDNRVTILSRQGSSLVPVGSITGLGAGEKIYAVRFEGPLGYVVTFKQTDPLFVVDLSNPSDPTLAGQLPLTGYSSFLQPLSGGLLLGVGQDVNSNLRTDGLQVSLFDVSHPSDPVLLDKQVVAGSSPAQYDPHALLYWAADGLVVMPVDEWGSGVCQGGPCGTPVPLGPCPTACPAASPFVGALAWKVTGSSLGTPEKISQPQSTPASPLSGVASAPAASAPAVMTPAVMTPAFPPMTPGIERALVVGDMLYTVSESGIMASSLSTLVPVSWMPYA